MGSPAGCRLSPQTHVCRGWTPRLARTSCLHALRAPAPGFAELGGARAKRGYHPCGLASHRPAASAALGAVPPSLDAMACVPSGRTSALRKRTGGSRASRAPGASPPFVLPAGWGRPALSRRNALRAPLRGGFAVAARRHGRGSPQRPAEGRAGLRPPGLAPASRLPTIQPRRIQPERGRSSS